MIRNSTESGNDVFHVFKDRNTIAVLPVCWKNQDAVFGLLDIHDGKKPGILTLDNPTDPRKFMVLYNREYNIHYPMVMILKYIEQDNDRVIVDVDKHDLDIVGFVRRELC